MKELLNNEQWFRGPAFLWEDTCKSSWPINPILLANISDEDPEVRPQGQTNHLTQMEERRPLDLMMLQYSSWYKFKRPVNKNFNAVSHNRSQPEVLFLNLTWRSRGQISSVLLQLLLFAFCNRKFGRHRK